MENAKLMINGWVFNLTKNNEKKIIEFGISDKFIGNLNDKNYKILKDYANKTLENVILRCKYFTDTNFSNLVTVYIDVEIKVPYSESVEYQINLDKVKEKDDVTIGDYTFTFIKNNEKIIMGCEVNNDKYLSNILENQYEMFQDYKNKILPKNIIIRSIMNVKNIQITIDMSNYGYTNIYYLYIHKQKSKKQELEELKVQYNTLDTELKKISEKIAKLEKN